MKKLYQNLILIGFIIFLLGGCLYVAGQLICLVLGFPERMIALERITKIIFPVASVSGLLCFLYRYLFKEKEKEAAE